MKKALSHIAPVCAVLLLLGLGAYLPRLVSLAVDHRLTQEITRLDDSLVHLDLSRGQDIFDMLDLFQGQNGQFTLTMSKGYQMTEEDVIATAWQLLSALPISGVGNLQVSPILITDPNASRSGVFWECVWDNRTILWLDDQSGLLVGLVGQLSGGTVTIEKYVDQEPVDQIKNFCRGHYPIDDLMLFTEFADADADLTSYTLNLYQFAEDLSTGQTAVSTHQLPILVQNNWLYFNV